MLKRVKRKSEIEYMESKAKEKKERFEYFLDETNWQYYVDGNYFLFKARGGLFLITNDYLGELLTECFGCVATIIGVTMPMCNCYDHECSSDGDRCECDIECTCITYCKIKFNL